MMSGSVNIAGEEDADRLWPTVKAAHVFRDRAEYERFRATAPWRVVVGPDGTAALLERWRDHLDLLAIRMLWAPPSKLPTVVRGIEDIAREQGFSALLSPLLAESVLPPYLAAGFKEAHRIVLLRAEAGRFDEGPGMTPAGISTRLALPDDMGPLAELDHDCFDEFWRYEPHRMAERLSVGRTMVAESDGMLVGYTHATIDRGNGSIGRLAVLGTMRRRGIGTALLSGIMRFLIASGADVVSLCTQEENAASRALYARVGLREMPERLVLLTKQVERVDG